MEFIKANFINTTGMITVSSNTATAQNLFNRDPFYQYYTDGFNNDLTTASISINFNATTSISRLALIDMNLKDFTIYYNGATANAFNFTGVTTSSNWNANAQTNLYLKCTSVACSSITIDMRKTITVDQEKRIGLLVLSDLILDMSQIPNAKGYKPKIIPKQVVHKLSDGGVRIHNVRKKWNVSISLDYISQSLRDSIQDIYDQLDPFNFCPFGTATSWDAFLFEAVWDGDFNFYEYSDNAASSGFSGDIKLKETPV